jgi:hypothetical protein
MSQTDNFALYDILLSNGCKIDLPSSSPVLSEEDAYKEAVQMIEAWSHEHNNTVDSFAEYSIAKKIEVFCNDGKRTVEFFRDFLTYAIFSNEDEDWEIPKKIFGAIPTKKCIKYLWTTRFNLLSYLNKKEFLYKSLKKLFVSTEQATNLSPKFFGKSAGEAMNTFVADLNSHSVKIRNRDVISVAKWIDLLFSRFLSDNPTAITPYINTRKQQGNSGGFIAKCFQDFEHIESQQKEIEKIMKEKAEEEKTKPKDLYRGIYHAYAGSSEIKHLINKGSPENKRTTKRATEDKGGKELSEIEKKGFAVNIHANYNLKKQLKTGNSSSSGQAFSSYFAKTPKRFLKSFREHENFAKRATINDTDIHKKYDFKPDSEIIEVAFRSCLVQKNRGKFDSIFN